MKVFSILFQSTTIPERISLFSTTNAKTAEEAYTEGLKLITENHGNLAWKATMTNVLDVNKETRTLPVRSIPADETNDLRKQKQNWLMEKIIKNKDEILFAASRNYLSDNEILYIQEKIK